MKVRITALPCESEMDGIKLDKLVPGTVRDVSPILGAWLMAQGYAELEMRQQPTSKDEDLQVTVKAQPHMAHDRRRFRR